VEVALGLEKDVVSQNLAEKEMRGEGSIELSIWEEEGGEVRSLADVEGGAAWFCGRLRYGWST
jgi:hypothetical protein